MKRMNQPSFDILACIRALVACSPRQLEGEKQALKIILAMLKKYDVPYALQRFTTAIPVATKTMLLCDGKRVPAEACSFESGRIDSKDVILSSAMPSRYCYDVPNISFNPSCPAFSPGNHYFAPAMTVTHAGLKRVLAASRIEGSVRVQKVRHQSANVLIGNARSPRMLCFAHYDSIKRGAIDNASGVAVTLSTILKNPALLKTCLFVIAGNEELSYDKPTYWGHGFRALERRSSALFKRAKKIVTVDCVGNGKPQIITDISTVSRAFPLANSAAFSRKTVLLTGDFAQLMTVYHSDLDDGRGIEERYLRESERMLARVLMPSSSSKHRIS